jgi:hypothetical protein
MAGIGVVLLVVTVLFAAPLALGSFVLMQRASIRAQAAWFSFLAALFLAALLAGGVSLLLLQD